jgi:hypothetical protein
MATVLEDCATEEQRSVVLFCGQKESMQRIFIKKRFLFTVGSVCRVSLFTAGGKRFADNGGEEMAETRVKKFMLLV